MSNGIHDASHPIWPLARLTVCLAAACFFLWLNATTFDATEVKAILGILVSMIGVEGIGRVFKTGDR